MTFNNFAIAFNLNFIAKGFEDGAQASQSWSNGPIFRRPVQFK